MERPRDVHTFVSWTAAIALCFTGAAWYFRLPFPGGWELGSFVLVAVLLESSGTRLRAGATGSLSFVMYLAAAILFGAFWATVVAVVSIGINQNLRQKPAIKTIFNLAQEAISICSAALLYHALGGGIPPGYLFGTGTASQSAVRLDLGLFVVLAATYCVVNSVAVSLAVALSGKQSFREVWHVNTRGVVGYDLTSSIIALFVAWVFQKSFELFGFGPWGLALVFAPIIAVRHVYSLYYQLQESGQELLQVMVKAIEARDPYTSGHSLRVRELSRAMAAELDVSGREIEEIETAALLHDVGKIHEEFAPLLRKEGRLTHEETAVMQTHAVRSSELVGIISKFRGPIQDSVRHHHERWDGHGYPDGLVGRSIPLGARIILISDTIDAMTTDRPYRKRLPLEIVIAELQKCKGTQFDPELVDVAVSSVAVRHLIGGHSARGDAIQNAPSRSRRVGWPTAALWRMRRA